MPRYLLGGGLGYEYNLALSVPHVSSPAVMNSSIGNRKSWFFIIIFLL